MHVDLIHAADRTVTGTASVPRSARNSYAADMNGSHPTAAWQKPIPMVSEATGPTANRDFVSGVYREYSPRIRSYLRSMVSDSDDAEDLLQDVFMQLVRTTGAETRIERMSAWLYRVARNSVLNLWRKRRTQNYPGFGPDMPERGIDDLSEMLFHPDYADPDRIYIRNLVWEELEDALSELPEEQSEIFCLTTFDGIPVKDIAETTGVPVATLLSRKHYAVKHLRLRLKGLYDDLLNF